MTKKKPEPQGPGTFDPWTATIEDSLGLQCGLDDPRSQLWQFAVANSLTKRRQLIERGGGRGVLTAIADCAKHGLALPPWLAAAFLSRFNAVISLQVPSWDDPAAFGPPHPKNTRLHRLRKDEAAEGPIYGYVQKLLRDDSSRAIDNSLFDDVAAHFAKVPLLGRSECSRIYYQAVKTWEPILGPVRNRAATDAAISNVIAVRRRIR